MDALVPDIGRTYGSILLGGFLACGLSGVVVIQCIIYFKLYPQDEHSIKAMVFICWFLDMLHTTFIFASIWDYFIKYFGVSARFDYIPWTVAFSVLLTALQTFFVQCYFAYKIFQSSHHVLWIPVPIVFLAFLRLVLACISTAEMIKLQLFSAFTRAYPGWVFTTGLTLSVTVDLLIMSGMIYYLHKLRGLATGSTTAIKLINTLMFYTLENGALTCLTALATLITWLAMPQNLIFMGLHFIIAKLYANSLLASLNTRQELLALHSGADASKAQGGGHNGHQSTVTALNIQGFTSAELGTIHENGRSLPPFSTTTNSESGTILSRRGGGAGAGGSNQRVLEFRRGSTSIWTRFLSEVPVSQGPPAHMGSNGNATVVEREREFEGYPLVERTTTIENEAMPHVP